MQRRKGIKAAHYWHWCSPVLLAVGCAFPSNAQVAPDGSVGTTVSALGSQYTVNNGTQVGGNLFHSFSQFSVPTGGAARFNNALTVQTIFARVTGGSVSSIDGLLQANGTASLFLLNPAGILFGPNARLNLGGSFVATTANSIQFADGVKFSATNATTTPLLTMSVPVGLQMGQNPAAITVQNTGHRLIETGRAPLQKGATPVGLSVASGNTLALVGGTITFDGGIVSAPSGHLELASVNAGTVNFTIGSPLWTFNYGNSQQFGTLQLLHQALADTSGTPAGSIHLQGGTISVNDGSVVLALNQGNQPPGGITVNASQSLALQGVGTNGFAQSLLITDATTGASGNLVLTAPQVQLQDGSKLQTRTFGAGTAGNIAVTADSLQVIGFSSLSPVTTRSEITSLTGGAGRSGDVQITTRQLSLQTGGSLLSATQSTGATGNVTVNATASINLDGENPFNFSVSFLGATSFGGGNTGNVTINTPKLTVLNGATVGASTQAKGNAGILRVNVSEQIIVNGISAASGKPSQISASAPLQPPAFQKAFGLSGPPTGNSGDLIIHTPRLELTDGGLVRVNNQGFGNAGNLYITADTLFLDRGGSITASTLAGEGGNITLQATDLLLMRHGSNITATAGGNGNGGNITINAPIIAGFENSDSVANAVKGRGGNINITTQGIIGLKYHDQLTPESDISASSQFGVSGTVQVNNIGVDPNAGLVELPTNVVDTSQQIATGCAGAQGSSFVATGRGGVPQNPTQQVRGDRTWDDLRDLSTYRKAGKTVAQRPAAVPVLLQADTWQRHTDGTVEFMADQSPAIPSTFATCSGVTASAIESAP